MLSQQGQVEVEACSVIAADAGTAGIATPGERNAILWLTNISHVVNHFQNGMLSILYPAIMTELGFGYLQLGVLTAIRNTLSSGTQGFYGFATPFLKRTRVLALANMIMGVGVLLSGFANSFATFVGARAVTATGSSAQHPIGASLLSGYFPKKRGTILALNPSIASVGGFIAPLLATFLLLFMGWRAVFFLVAGVSALMGIAYLFFREPAQPAATAASNRQRAQQGFRSYRKVLRNRNILVISLVMMVGAAGRGGGINDTYLVPHLQFDLGLSTVMAGIAKSVQQGGSIMGPLGFGWLSDRMSRKWVIQASLVLSALGSWWLAFQGPSLAALLPSLVVYGAFTSSRMTLTQALVADSVPDEERDAAFSLFYFIGFISVTFWGLLTGVLMEYLGFSIAFSILACSYIIGVLLMFGIRDTRDHGEAKAPTRA